MRTLIFVVAFLAAALAHGEAFADARPCTASEMTKIWEPAAAGNAYVEVKCQATLRPGDVITKKLDFVGDGASGAGIECNGARIEGGLSPLSPGRAIDIYSTQDDHTKAWSRPHDIRISGCKIKGRVRIYGVAAGFNDDAIVSSHTRGHTRRMRAAAPHDIVFDEVTLESTDGKIPLYLFLGVTRVKLLNSTIRGDIDATAIYLGAESGFNTIEGNRFEVTSHKREVIAIDSSSDNRIVANRFAGLNHGGIFLYRNCGQDTLVRHTTPSRNQIIDNIFYYDKYKGDAPAVWVASRDGSHFGKPGYCDKDKGYPVGSSVDNRDFARQNVVMQNRIIKRSVSDMIKVRNPDLNSPNWIAHNTTVSSASPRRSGCFLPTSYDHDLLLDGQSAQVVVSREGHPRCEMQKCVDGKLVSTGVCSVQTKELHCAIEGNNGGCSDHKQCEQGHHVLAVTAACNLEHGSVSARAVQRLRPGQLRVIRPSDKVNEGRCQVGNTTIRHRWDIIRGSTGRRVDARCREHDSNGGDCELDGVVYCGAGTGETIDVPASVPADKVRPKANMPGPLPQVQPGVLGH